MSDEIVNIIHKITYEVQDRELDHAVKTVKGNITGIENLTKRQIRLVEQFNRTNIQDVRTRERLNRMINQNATALNHHRRSLEDNLVSNRSLNNALNQEIGLVGNLERRLQILSQARRRATSAAEIDRYNNLISRTKNSLNVTNPVRSINQNGGLLSGLGLGVNGGAISRLLPMIGGAIGISQLGSQIKDVTQRFESYRTTLRNTFQSSIKANEEFAKIKEFAEKTPFAVDELTSSFIKLVNRGFVPTMDELTNIGDLAASQGKSFDQLVEAILDAQTGEFERLKEFGIKARTSGDMVTLSFKGIEKQVKKTDEQALRNAVISFGKLQGVAGGMNAQAKTLSGTVSNLGDSFDSLFSAIGDKGVSQFNDLLGIVKESVDWFTKLIETSPADSYREQQAELNNLVGQLIIANDQEEVRSVIMSEITAKYPEFLNLIDAEKSNTEQLASALSVLNQQYENKIRLALIDEQQSRITEKQTDLIRKQRDAIKTLLPELKKYGYTEVSFSRLSPSQQQKVGNQILTDLTNKSSSKSKGFESNTMMPGSGMISNQFKETAALDKFRSDFANFNKLNNQLNKERVHNIELANAENESYINGLKESLALEQKELQALKKSGANQKEILAQEKLIQGIKDLINPPKPNIAKSTTDTKKKKTKTKKAKDPNEIALDEIDRQMKVEQELEKQRFQRRKEELLNALESELIDRQTYSQRLTEAVEENGQKLLEIELKYALKRPQYLKKAEKEANQTRIDEIKNSFKEYSDAIRERSEKIIKQLIDEQKNIDDEIFKLSADSRAKEIANSKRDSNNRITTINNQLSSLYTSSDNLNSDLNSSNSDVVKSATNQLEVVNANIKKLHELRAKIIEDGRIKERDINLKYDLQELDDLKDSANNKIDIYTDSEQRRFFRVYQTELDNNQRELDILKRKQANIEDSEKLSKRKCLKLEKQYEKDSEEIAYRSDLARLFNDKKVLEDRIKRLKSDYNILTEEEKKARDKQINVTQTQLGSSQRNIETKVRERRKKNRKEKEVDENGDTPFQALAKDIIEISDGATQAANTITSALQQAVDLEISIREKRVERLKSIAERGNAELLQLEEKRLQRAQAQQEKYARSQIAINAAQQASASLLAIANAAAAGHGFLSLPAVLATIGALVSGFAMVKSMTQDTTGTLGFKDGVVGLNGPGSETSDSIPARLSRGESVITAKGTRAGDNAEILKMMNNGIAFNIPEMHQMINSVSNVPHPNLKMKDSAIVTRNQNEKTNNDFKELKSEIIELRHAVENQKPSSFSFDQDGIFAVTNAINDKKRKRDLL
ncbi:hypothetical protein [Empedobacter brevis]|uniref:hypothetical protein n=1 Tax=Empedobacter brevis TaxID=247 RepID=UPI0028AF17D0|nr:hypothetical protein [Empedobacter brevis]